MDKKRTVAYCRVSTMKEEQLDSFHMQQQFFREFCDKNDSKYDLIHVYADEGKSGTKMKSRPQLLEMLEAAKRKEFEVVLVKDVSRLARNIKDFLNILDQLRTMKIKLLFVNYNLDSEDGSSFQLGILALVAEEESANTSKRIKMSKRMNAQKGRVPNIVFGFDKTKGDYFNLTVNEEEAKTVNRIFKLYAVEGYGENKIANLLNEEGLKTKRECRWTQNAISRILQNRLYLGEVTNGRQEISSFLTGERMEKDELEWCVVTKPELRIVSDELFERAKTEKEKRVKAYNISGQRRTEKYVFSQLIKCKCCGYSFMRFKRTYQNTYIRWMCSQRYGKGVYTCVNGTTIDEKELIAEIKHYFIELLENKGNFIRQMKKEFVRLCGELDEAAKSEKQLLAEQTKIKNKMERELDIFRNELCTIEELRDKTGKYKDKLSSIEQQLKMLEHGLTRTDVFSEMLNRTFKDIETLINAQEFSNEMLGKVIDNILVDQDGQIEVNLKMFDHIGLRETVQIADVGT